jgi:hypothetical protein
MDDADAGGSHSAARAREEAEPRRPLRARVRRRDRVGPCALAREEARPA